MLSAIDTHEDRGIRRGEGEKKAFSIGPIRGTCALAQSAEAHLFSPSRLILRAYWLYASWIKCAARLNRQVSHPMAGLIYISFHPSFRDALPKFGTAQKHYIPSSPDAFFFFFFFTCALYDSSSASRGNFKEPRYLGYFPASSSSFSSPGGTAHLGSRGPASIECSLPGLDDGPDQSDLSIRPPFLPWIDIPHRKTRPLVFPLVGKGRIIVTDLRPRFGEKEKSESKKKGLAGLQSRPT